MLTNEGTAEGKLIILGTFIVEQSDRDTSETNIRVVRGRVILEDFVFASLT